MGPSLEYLLTSLSVTFTGARVIISPAPRGKILA